jgi:hypothetical protein
MTIDHVSSENGYSIASSTEDRGLESLSYQTKNYKTGICCFSAKHAAIRRKGRDLLARNQDNMFEWRDMYTNILLLQ